MTSTCTSCNPIVCDLTAFSPEDKREHAALLARALAATSSTTELEDGFQFTYPSDPAIAADVARWVVYEQRCCPFLAFDLTFSGRLGLELRVRGPAEAKGILREAFRSVAPVDV